MVPELCYFVLLYAPVSSSLAYRFLITDPSINFASPTFFAYLDVGHAESWRDYWSSLDKSLILGKTEWPGEYYVKFWSPEWLKVMKLEIAKIADRGYAGVFLDNLDACLNVTWADPSACSDMEKLVEELNAYAKFLGLKVIVNLGSVPWMGLDLPVYGVLREQTLCPLDREAWSYLLEIRKQGKVVIDVEYNLSEACYERALEASSEGVHVYLAPSPSLDEPSPYCVKSPEVPMLFPLIFFGGRRGWAGSDPPRAHRTPGHGATKRGTGVREG